jgi:hypothetical protein
MERSTAIRKLTKVLGRRAYWRIGQSVTSPDRRREYTLRTLDNAFAVAMLDRDLSIRREALLNADETYQALKKARAASVAEREQTLQRGGGGFKFEVGLSDGFIMSPKAYGDTWEQVFEQLQQRQDGAR